MLGLAQDCDRPRSLARRHERPPFQAEGEGCLESRSHASGRLRRVVGHPGSLGGLSGGEQHGRPAPSREGGGQLQLKVRRVLLGKAGVSGCRLRVADGERDERQALPVEAALDGHRARPVLADELEQQLVGTLNLSPLEPRHAESPPGPAATVGNGGAGQPRVERQALRVGGDRAVEVAGEVESPAELEECAIELIGAR